MGKFRGELVYYLQIEPSPFCFINIQLLLIKVKIGEWEHVISFKNEVGLV